MRNMIYSFKPKPVLMEIVVCAVFSEKDEGCLCSESGCCSDILTLFCSWVSAIQTGLGTGVVPGGPPGNQAGPPAIRLVVST